MGPEHCQIRPYPDVCQQEMPAGGNRNEVPSGWLNSEEKSLASLKASALPMPPDLQANIAADLRRRYGPGLSTTFVHRAELIGGMRIQVGSDLYDGSVRVGLAALEKIF